MSETSQFLTFGLAGETYGIGIKGIREIIEHGGLTKVPMMPNSVRGVINLRGNVVPVVDLSIRFGRKATEILHRTCIIIVEIESAHDLQSVGVLVDTVNEVIDLAPADIEPAPSFGTELRADFVRGMGKVGDDFVVLLEIQHALALGEFAIMKAAS